MKRAKKFVIVTLSSAAGTAIGYPIYLSACLALLIVYGDNPQNGESVRVLEHLLFYGTFIVTTFLGLGFELYMVTKSPETPSRSAHFDLNP